MYSGPFKKFTKDFYNNFKTLEKENKTKEFFLELTDFIEISQEIFPDDILLCLEKYKIPGKLKLSKLKYSEKLDKISMFQISSEDNKLSIIIDGGKKEFPLINLHDYIISATDKKNLDYYILLAYLSQESIFEMFQIGEAVDI
jgi:hypothetical protein